MARLLEHYREVVVPKLQEEFSYKNPMQVPRIEKIVINMAVGEGGSGLEEARPTRRPS